MRTIMKKTSRGHLASIFYWIGVSMTFASIALVLLGNTKLIATVQHTSFPLAWKLAIVAVLAFLASEICHSASSLNHRQEHDSRHALDHTPYEI
jgi:hypothetical protein